jgi:hypothetical protein
MNRTVFAVVVLFAVLVIGYIVLTTPLFDTIASLGDN